MIVATVQVRPLALGGKRRRIELPGPYLVVRGGAWASDPYPVHHLSGLHVRSPFDMW